jgi:hypothetical protein
MSNKATAGICPKSGESWFTLFPLVAISVLSGDTLLILISLLRLGGVAHRLAQLVGLRLKDKRSQTEPSQASQF